MLDVFKCIKENIKSIKRNINIKPCNFLMHVLCFVYKTFIPNWCLLDLIQINTSQRHPGANCRVAIQKCYLCRTGVTYMPREFIRVHAKCTPHEHGCLSRFIAGKFTVACARSLIQTNTALVVNKQLYKMYPAEPAKSILDGARMHFSAKNILLRCTRVCLSSHRFFVISFDKPEQVETHKTEI